MNRGIASAFAVLLLASACDRRAADPPAAATSGGGRPASVTVARRQLSQIGVTRVEPVSWTAEIRTTGTVDWNADRTTQVIPQVSGPISRIVVDLGRRVKAGEPLLYVSSPDLASAISTYRKARNRLDLARRTLERNKDLLEHRAIAQKDYEASQADYNDADTEAQSALQVLRIYSVSKKDIEAAEQQNLPLAAELPVRSPIAGVVVQKLVLPGQLVQAGTTACFVVTDTSSVWVQGHLRESEVAAVRIGDHVDVRGQAASRVFPGVVTYVGAMLDPATRTTPVRIATANRDGVLKKDEFVDLVVRTSTRRDVLTVPASSVLYTDEDLPFVYRQVEPGRFARTIVGLGAQRGDRFEVLSGLRAGDTIVSQGGVFLQFAETSER